MPQLKTPHLAQTERSNERILPQLRLIVRVPCHAVLSVPVEIGQYAVEVMIGVLFDKLLNPDKRIYPGKRLKTGS